MEIREKYFNHYCDIGFYSKDSNRDKDMNASCVTLSFYFYSMAKNDREFMIGYDIMAAFFSIDDFFDGKEENYKNELLKERLYKIINDEHHTNNDQNNLYKHEKFLIKFVKDSKEYSETSNSKRTYYLKCLQGWISYIYSIGPYNNLNNENCDESIHHFLRHFDIAYYPAECAAIMMEIQDLDPIVFLHPKFYLIFITMSKSMALINDIQSFEKEYLENEIQNNYLYKWIKKNYGILNSDTFNIGVKHAFNEINELNEKSLKLETEILDEYQSKLSEKHFKQFKNCVKASLSINGGNFVWGINTARYTTKHSLFVEMKENYRANCTNYLNSDPLFTLICKHINSKPIFK